MKKKGLVIIFVMAVLAVMVTTASALTLTEKYTGYQYIGENSSYNFGFDFWYNNNVYGVGTDSSLGLAADASGAAGYTWESATLYIDFYSKDWTWEEAGMELMAWNEYGNGSQSFNLGTISGYLGGWGQGGQTYHYSYDFSPIQLAAFGEWGWGNVTISAVPTDDWWHYNDFAITTVGIDMDVAPVPEPATMLLFGTGLAGLALYRRKRMK